MATCIYGQTSLSIEYGREIIWQNGLDAKEPFTLSLSADHMLTRYIGISAGFRKSYNSKIGSSNSSTQSQPYFAILERGTNSTSELFIGSTQKFNRFSVRIGLGFVISTVNSTNTAVYRENGSSELLDEQIIKVSYKSNSFLRSSFAVRYSLFSKNGFALVPYVEFMHDFRPVSNDYNVNTSDPLRPPFSEIDVLNDFRRNTKSIFVKPNYFNIGISIQYTW